LDGWGSLVRNVAINEPETPNSYMLHRIYDFTELLTIASVIYGFSGGVPLVVWFVLRQMDAKLKLINAICLYGYSLTIFIPAAV
jgi:hypothetical protein